MKTMRPEPHLTAKARETQGRKPKAESRKPKAKRRNHTMNATPGTAGAAGTAQSAKPQSTKPVEWQIDPAHSAAHFSVRHLMISNVRGESGKLSGTVVIDPADVTKSTVEVGLDAASINTREPQRDEHLRSADFLDAAN